MTLAGIVGVMTILPIVHCRWKKGPQLAKDISNKKELLLHPAGRDSKPLTDAIRFPNPDEPEKFFCNSSKFQIQ